MSVIRGTCMTGYPALVTELGGDPEPLLARAGIRRSDIGRFDAFITYPALIHAIESAAAATHTSDFGRRLAERQGIEILGPVGVAGRTSKTAAEAFATFEQYLGAYSPAISATLSPELDPNASFLEFKILIPHPPAHPQTTELSLGVMLRVLRFLLGAGYAPTVVHLPHQPLTAREDYLRYFSCTPQFGSSRAGFSVSTDDLQRPLVRDEMAHRVVLDYLDTVIGRHRGTISSSARELIRQLLPTGAATVPVIADQFRLHPKALRRRLASEGTTFNAVVDDVRRELTERYLRDTDMTLNHLARQLGYAEQSVLSRSCQRWFGASPASLRAQWQQAQVPPTVPLTR
ncbi:AraC family transcriptional regulator [Mycobacterium ostraviense]|uniref:AraC family transcriptional regulator n=1 Tax=Mycobacterium ostraviense TaxID=2738409 RepID=A0A163XV31_9MYCO|nr:AraC family transcriptional regulator [Mycobacterium ostraviense]KZS59786.1 AraC family transcriptional regulator [Mycobacterium ostraviense]UGT93516.1 AraC family transcriptional regulator [Mycobacterium ostraviense]